MFRRVLVLFAAACSLSSTPAQAIDLTTLDATATVQSVIFTQGNTSEGELTNFAPFLRIQATGTEQGFNTDYRPLEPDAIGTLTTRSLAFSSLRRRFLTSPAGYYLEFHIDVNEGTIGGASFLSIDQLRIYSAFMPTIPNLATLMSAGTLLYDLDNPSDQQILLDSALEPGSGTADLTIQIPTWYFDGVPSSSYLYFFFRAGSAGIVGARDYGSSGGFEEVLALLPNSATDVETETVAGAPSIRIVGGTGSARFRCSVPEAGLATIGLYDVRGRRIGSVRRDMDGAAVFEAPLAEFFRGREAASGIYFYRFDWNGVERNEGKVTLLR